MILTPHILVGAAIGSQIPSPFLAFVASFVGHYFLEALPHYEYNVSRLKDKQFKFDKASLLPLAKIGLDVFTGAALALWLVLGKSFSSSAMSGMLGAVLPDGLLFLYWHFPQPALKFFEVPHRALHIFKDKCPEWLGIMVETLISFGAILFLASQY